MPWTVIEGDCVKVMRKWPANSFDAVVCDPPYGLEFMGKKWDRLSGQPGYNEKGRVTDRPDHATCFAGASGRGVNSYQAGRTMQEWHEGWAREALRVLKPGGHLLAFGGTRTYHRLVCAVEDAGFEIRDTITWMYGSGFPKSRDVSKAIDAVAGKEREVVGTYQSPEGTTGFRGQTSRTEGYGLDSFGDGDPRTTTAPATPEAEQWSGWGTALKPASEPIVVARKPLIGTVVKNVLEHGTGALNIDASRIGTNDKLGGGAEKDVQSDKPEGWDRPWRNDPEAQAAHAERIRQNVQNAEAKGRWPANVVLSHTEDCEQVGTQQVRTGTAVRRNVGKSGGNFPFGAANPDAREDVSYAGSDGKEEVEAWECAPDCPVAMLDAQTGDLHAQDPATRKSRSTATGVTEMGTGHSVEYADRGGASRFFYVAKASRAERNAGLDGFEEQAKPVGMHTIASRKCRVCGSKTKPSGANPEPWPACGHDDWEWASNEPERHRGQMRNSHPTVKPIALMRWLVRLVTPPGGTVLDPFTGSGTTGIAATVSGFNFVGIEQQGPRWVAEHEGDDDYVAIASARIAHWEKVGYPPPKPKYRPKIKGGVQLDFEEGEAA